MPWTIPDKGEGQNDLQSILFQEYLDALVAGLNGVDCVLSGGAVTAQGSPNMTVAVAKAAVLSNGTLFAVAANSALTITTADGTNPRLDLVVVNSSGSLAVRTGTAAAAPKPAARSANDVVLAVIYVPASDTSISTDQITDMRVLRQQGPIVLKKTTSAVTFNTTLAIQTYFTITLPSGLFLAGRQLRVQCGGSYLMNSGTATFTYTVAYGGTTLFADATAAGTADADRGAWFATFVLNASGNAVQQLGGMIVHQTPGAKTAPTTGLGDLAVVTHVAAPVRGSAAVDSDAGDRTFTVQVTMSVSNVADEFTMDWGVAELL